MALLGCWEGTAFPCCELVILPSCRASQPLPLSPSCPALPCTRPAPPPPAGPALQHTDVPPCPQRRSGLRPELAPNLLLALMWASQANAVPATFWAIAFLLLPGNSKHQATVLEELQQELARTEKQGAGEVVASEVGLPLAIPPPTHHAHVLMTYPPPSPIMLICS